MSANGTVAHLRAHPTQELTDFIAIAARDSTASCSTVRKDFVCDDGVLAVSSHRGQPVQYATSSG